ncbi:MAG: hypothetical protein JSU09_00320 [Bacteroidetes bacterium]|nr:hypothetical protein [Bacteroidota bacterium]
MLKSNFDIRWLTFMDVQEGFKILAPTPVVIPWKTDPRELLFHHPDLVSEANGITINYPVQIGKIIVKENTTYKKQGWNLPLFISDKGIKTYKKVKSALEVMMRGEGSSKDEQTDDGTTRFYISRSKLAFRLEYPLPDSQVPIQVTHTDGCLLSIEFNSLVSHESKKDNRKMKEHTDNYRREHGY